MKWTLFCCACKYIFCYAFENIYCRIDSVCQIMLYLTLIREEKSDQYAVKTTCECFQKLYVETFSFRNIYSESNIFWDFCRNSNVSQNRGLLEKVYVTNLCTQNFLDISPDIFLLGMIFSDAYKWVSLLFREALLLYLK